MQVNLTANERAVLVAALSFYRVKKSAERALESQKLRKTDKQASDKIAGQYNRLLAVVDDVAERLNDAS